MNQDIRAEAERTAIHALSFISRDTERLEDFLTRTGITSEGVRQLAGEPEFLRGVLEHILSDETMLLVFCREAGLSSRDVWAARRALGGAPSEWG